MSTKTLKRKNKIIKEKKTEETPPKNSLFSIREAGVVRTGGFFSRNIFIILAFSVPFLLMCVAFAIMGCEPFGDKQILVTDLWHQYFPFLVDFQDKLKHGESLFWSWTQGGGTNYFALMSYYLASPLKFLTVFIPYEWLRVYLTFSVAFKIGLAGGFFALFLRYTFKRDDISLLIFSVGFALSAFFMGYYWCEIWLDTAALTPLVVMGFVALMRENKFRLFIITLALSVLANYYIGLFTCIFILLCFIGYQFCAWGGIKKFGRDFLHIGVSTVIALLLTTFFILPAFFGLQNTHAAGSTFPTGYAINIGTTNDLAGTLDAIKQVISNSIAFIPPATTEGLPNIACGVISIVLGIMFMVSRKIKVREKIFNGVLLLFLILSFIIRQLDYMWHGFHFTNMIPYRFSYLVSFVLVVMAFRAFSVIDFANFFDLIIASLVTTLIVLLAIGVQEVLAIVGTAIIAAVILAILFIYKKKIIGKEVLAIILTAIVVIQGGATAYMGVKTTTVTGTYEYPRGEENTENVVNYMKELEKDTPELWRAEFTSTQTLCDSSLNRFNGVSMFNSMTNESFTRFAQNFGLMGWLSGNRYTYAESSPVTNLFMNLKYIIARDGNYNNTQYLDEVYLSGNVRLTKNSSYIPMGFMTKADLLDYEGEDDEDTYNPFDKQNEFFKLATGIDKDVYEHLEVVSQGHTDYNVFPVNKLSYGNYSFSTNGTTEAPHLKWNYEAPKDGYYYAYVQITDGDNITVMCNDAARTGTSSFYIKRPYIMAIGYFNKGDKISIYSDLKAEANGSATVYVNYFNPEVYEEGYAVLDDSVMTTTKLTGSSMEGEIDVKEDGLFYTSVPYEAGKTEDDSLIGKLLGSENEGWTAYVDGEKVEITPIANALVSFKLSKGKHTIRLSYLPKGFIKGSILSAIALAAFLALILCPKFIKKRKKDEEELVKTKSVNNKE